MEIGQAIGLIKHKSISGEAKTCWADLGCGSGTFTNALAHLLKPGSKIFAVDKNEGVLRTIKQSGEVFTEKIVADFILDELNLVNLDGIMMANSLHFVQDKKDFIHKIEEYLSPAGCFLIVEYDMDKPNQWVPFPASYDSLCRLFRDAAYTSIERIGELPSKYNRATIYSALIKK